MTLRVYINLNGSTSFLPSPYAKEVIIGQTTDFIDEDAIPVIDFMADQVTLKTAGGGSLVLKANGAYEAAVKKMWGLEVVP